MSTPATPSSSSGPSQTSHPSHWFDPLYRNAERDVTQVPWATAAANPLLRQALDSIPPVSGDRTAIVVGCGLGDDAELLSQAGYRVTAFDISESAIAWCRERFPSSPVHYQVADLFQLPTDWQHSFDLAFESITIQALPLDHRQASMDRIASLVRPEGDLWIHTYLRPSEEPPSGPPWPLTLDELNYFETLGFEATRQQTQRKKDSRFPQRIWVEYQRQPITEKTLA